MAYDYNLYRHELRRRFLGFISNESEARWAAGWMMGIEDTLRSEQGIWLAMAVACGGWPKGYLAENGWDPLTTDELLEWKRITDVDTYHVPEGENTPYDSDWAGDEKEGW